MFVLISKYKLIAPQRYREHITMGTLKCLCCRRQVPANPRLKKQNYCGRPDCQRARKKAWQRKKMATDTDYQENQRNAQKQWQEHNPDYWQKYRRNRHKPPPAAPVPQRVKMDTLSRNSHLISGEYLISPSPQSSVKMDTLWVKISPVSESYPSAKKDSIGISTAFSYDSRQKTSP